MAARDTPTSWYVVRALAARRRLGGVIWERRRTRRETLRFVWRRARRLGPVKVGDELLLRLVCPLVEGRHNRRVARELLGPPAARRRPVLPDAQELTVRSVNQRAARDLLRDRAVDVLLLCGTSIVKPALLDIPRLATLNIHAGITPAYRGVHSPFWALLNGERDMVGVTLHHVDPGIDSGRIILQERLAAVRARETPTSLWYQLLPLAADLADRAIAAIERGRGDGIDPAATGLPSRLYTHPGLSDYLRLRCGRGPAGGSRRARRAREAREPHEPRERPGTGGAGDGGRRPWRILHLTATTQLGGTERSIIELVRNQDPHRFESAICSLRSGGRFHAAAGAAGIPTHDLGWRGFADLRGATRLFRILRRGRFDLVQIYGLTADLLGRPLCRLAGAPVVISSIRSTDPWRRAHHVWFDRLTARLVDLWISNSEAGRLTTIRRERRRPDQVVTVHTGIAADSLRARATPAGAAAARRALELPDGAVAIGQIANLKPMKGHREVIEAIPAVFSRHPDAYFVFAGRDELGGAMQRLARDRGVSSHVRFVGFRHDVPALLAVLDLVLLPSRWEGLPFSILEAMAMGKPVLATAVGGVNEMLRPGETGVLLAAARPRLIADAIVSLLSDRAVLRRMGCNAAAVVRRDFGCDRFVARMEAIYAGLLARRGAGTAGRAAPVAPERRGIQRAAA